jgi:hypothetical protein
MGKNTYVGLTTVGLLCNKLISQKVILRKAICIRLSYTSPETHSSEQTHSVQGTLAHLIQLIQPCIYEIGERIFFLSKVELFMCTNHTYGNKYYLVVNAQAYPQIIPFTTIFKMRANNFFFTL